MSKPDDGPAESVTRRSFERQTGLFTGTGAIFSSAVISPLAWLEPLSPDWIALDVACGAGHVAETIASRVRQVVGVDLTRALLDLGTRRLAEAGIENVLLQEGDAAALPFADATFDLVVCRAALHHFPDPAVQVAEMARVCRPGGRVVVSDMVAPSGGDRESFDELHRVIDPSHARCLADAEIADLMTTHVGAVTTRTEPGETYSVPVEMMLTDAGRPDDARAALEAELAGGPPTGFRPARTQDAGITVTFERAVVASTRR
ncbi:MAG TPA: methyltransferase domain-containing protein [Amycolatopsis sp.]|nr:methyltransferase domain-containing protein [Amycolatopsis sp.]